MKAFQGIKKGDDAKLNINLTASGKGAFKIHVRLDNPWKGEEVAVFNIPEDFPKNKALTVSEPVPALEGLKGKHAIYLVFRCSASFCPSDNNHRRWSEIKHP